MNDIRLQLINRGLDSVEGLPAAERADYYDAAAALLRPAHPDIAATAARAAAAIREANAAQLLMSSLLRSAETPSSH
jgi:hypothetical protein